MARNKGRLPTVIDTEGAPDHHDDRAPEDDTASPIDRDDTTHDTTEDEASRFVREGDVVDTVGGAQPTPEQIARAIGEDRPDDGADAPTGAAASSGFAMPDPSAVFNGIFAPTQQGEGAKERAKSGGKASAEKLTPEERAKAGFLGGAMVEQLLNVGSRLFGSEVTVKSFSDMMTAPIRDIAASKGIVIPQGVPVDILTDGPMPLVQSLSAVMCLDGETGAWRPIRCTPGLAVLLPSEMPVRDPNAPMPGECFVVTVEATVAHAIMYNLADVPTDLAKRIAAFLERHEKTIRMGYAVSLGAGFLGFAYSHRRR